MESHPNIEKLLSLWGMEGEAIAPAPDPAGIARKTNVWFVGERYVLKRSEDAERLRRSFALARLLDAQGLEAATAVPSLDGSELVEDGGSFVCLMKRIPGSHLRSRELYEPGGEEKARRLGEAVGKLSMALRGLDAPAAESDFGQTVFSWAFPRATELVSLPEGFCRTFAERLGQLLPLLPRQLVHRDPNLGNLLFSGGRFAFLDFDLAERNARVFDPVYAAGSVLSETFDEEKLYGLARWLPVWRSILRGYDSAAALTPEEREAAPYILAGIECIFVAWCAEQPSMRGLFDASAAMLRTFCERFSDLRL